MLCLLGGLVLLFYGGKGIEVLQQRVEVQTGATCQQAGCMLEPIAACITHPCIIVVGHPRRIRLLRDAANDLMGVTYDQLPQHMLRRSPLQCMDVGSRKLTARQAGSGVPVTRTPTRLMRAAFARQPRTHTLLGISVHSKQQYAYRGPATGVFVPAVEALLFAAPFAL
jgi:hypothetical protein